MLNKRLSNIEIRFEKTNQNCDIELHYFAFSEVIDSYPKLDLEDRAHSKIRNECNGHWDDERKEWLWQHCCGCLEQSVEDNYGVLIEKLWIELDVEEQKCACYVCTYKGSHIFGLRRNCDKNIRQRLKKRPYRTCRFCQKKIPTNQFEEK